MNASLSPSMVKQSYTVRFTTPAFLGDADQNGAWRTPPFKALLRQWWRVVVAKENVEELRKAEGELFGSASDNDFCKSKVRIRLESWSKGELNHLPVVPEFVCHKEVDLYNLPTHIRQRYYCAEHNAYHKVAASLYLGFGPVGTQGIRKAITPESDKKAVDQENRLLLAVPNEQNECFESIMQLVHWFGAIGGRSRNGWGSVLLENSEIKGFDTLNQSNLLLKLLARPLDECLSKGKDWPHSLGRDEKGFLVWKTGVSYTNWRDAMKELARVKILFRTTLQFNPERHHRIDRRHILAYPITHHNFQPWGNQIRLANQLRFKIIAESNQFFGIAYHLPCSIPTELQQSLSQADRHWINQQQLSIWQTVHQQLDAEMQRI